MKIVTSAELTGDLQKFWNALGDDAVVVVKQGRPLALVTNIVGRTLQQVEQDHTAFRAYQAVRGMQERSQKRGTSRLTAAGIDQEIQQARRSRRSKQK